MLGAAVMGYIAKLSLSVSSRSATVGGATVVIDVEPGAVGPL